MTAVLRRSLLALLMAAALPGPARASGEEQEARAFLSAVIGRPQEKRKARAEKVLKRLNPALQTAPFDVTLLLLKIAALGTAARASSFSESVAARYGSRSGDTLNALRQIAPDHPWTALFSGIWQVEVRRRGGSLGASFLGTSLEDGVAQMNDALARGDPADPALPFAIAVTLMAYDVTRYAQKGEAMIDETLRRAAATPDTTVSKTVRRPAEVLQGYLENRRFDKVERLCLELM